MLSTNHLIEGIPPFIGKFSSLQVLFAFENVLGGHIPDASGQLGSINKLNLAISKLSGSILLSLYNLSSMTTFSLFENEFSGSLPTNLFLTLPHLQLFLINENQFTGSLPVSLSNASELQYFQVTKNNFTRNISINFGGLHRFKVFLAGRNNLGSGDNDEMNLLQSLVNCSSLQEISLQDNQFKGTLPNVPVIFQPNLPILQLAKILFLERSL